MTLAQSDNRWKQPAVVPGEWGGGRSHGEPVRTPSAERQWGGSTGFVQNRDGGPPPARWHSAHSS